MSLYHRGNIWWCRFTAPSGKRIFESTGTEDRLAAQQFEDLLKAEYWRVQKLGERPNYTWQQAVTRWRQRLLDLVRGGALLEIHTNRLERY